eukprot:6477813-Amphidinium_carterae.1
MVFGRSFQPFRSVGGCDGSNGNLAQAMLLLSFAAGLCRGECRENVSSPSKHCLIRAVPSVRCHGILHVDRHGQHVLEADPSALIKYLGLHSMKGCA